MGDKMYVCQILIAHKNSNPLVTGHGLWKDIPSAKAECDRLIELNLDAFYQKVGVNG